MKTRIIFVMAFALVALLSFNYIRGEQRTGVKQPKETANRSSSVFAPSGGYASEDKL